MEMVEVVTMVDSQMLESIMVVSLVSKSEQIQQFNSWEIITYELGLSLEFNDTRENFKFIKFGW